MLGSWLVRELAGRLGVGELLDRVTVKKRSRGYSPAQAILGLCETLIAGGECLDDVALLRADSAQELLRGHVLPEPTTLGRFLRRFSLGHIGQLNRALDELFARVDPLLDRETVTLDLDATYIEHHGPVGSRQGTRGTYGFRDHLKPIPLTGLRAHLQGSSRYSIGTAGARMIEQTFVQLEDGIQRVTLPLPTGPKHVHCYLADGTLFDTGLGLGNAPWGRLQAQRIAITHFHPDHVGGASVAGAVTGAAVYQGGLDYAQCERVWGSRDWPERIASWFRTHGVPAALTDELIEQGHAFAPFIRFARDPELLYEGSRLDDWQVIELPGHADGHLGFLREGVLIAGDHLLARISPAVGLYPESRPDPLGDYLASLERTIELAPRVAYPGHGEPINDPPARARELIEHHRDRLDKTRAALGPEPRSAYDVSLVVFGAELGPTQRRFAVAETLSHLERLVREGHAARTGDDRAVTYTGP